MSKKALLATILFLAALLFSAIIAGRYIRDYLYPTKGEITELELQIEWLNGTTVTEIDWGPTTNATEHVMEPMNITNISNVPVTLNLSYWNTVNILSLDLTWNYTGNTLNPNDFEVVEIYQNATATGAYSYNTVITAEEV